MTWLFAVFKGLLGGFNPLRDAAAGLWHSALRNPWRAIAIWFAIMIVINVFLLRRERAENAQLRADIAEIAKGQKQAGRDQAAVNHAPAAISQAIAKESRADEKAIYEAGRAAGAAYADSHRVRPPAVCAASPAGVPGTDRPDPQHDGPGDAADMVAISTANFDTCTVNSQRLAKVRADAQALIAAGVAVADTSEPQEASGQ